MAKMESPVFNSIRGSIGGATYFTTPAGQIICRNRTHPVNPQTGLQTLRRAGFAYMSAAWELLSSADKTSWKDYADSLSTGQSGRAIFIANLTVANWAYTVDNNVIVVSTAPPTDPGVLPIADIEVILYTAVGTGIRIEAFNPNAYPIVFIVQRSRQFSVSRNRLQGPFLASTTVVESVNSVSTLSLDFENLVENGVYFIKLRAVKEESFHTISASYIVRAIAVKNAI